jgi:prepilin-type N-terminal cleavage/methylation domain-containing protein
MNNLTITKRALQHRPRSKAGFTLIEVIVVLVILAILAAIAIPALTGYIDKAKQRTIIAEAREAKVAITELLVEQKGAFGSNPIETAKGANYDPAVDYVFVTADPETGTNKLYPCNSLPDKSANVDALGYKEWIKLTDISPYFYQPVQGYWNSGPCGVLNAAGDLVGFRTFILQDGELYAVTYNVHLYDTNGSWHEELDDSGWVYYTVDMATDAITKH